MNDKKKFAARTIHLEQEGAYAVLAKANRLEQEGKEIIHLEIGQPDFPTFDNISSAAVKAIKNGDTRYTPSSGKPALKEAIADYTFGRTGVTFKPSEVVVGPGAKPLLFFPMMALLEPGDEAIYPDPGFPSYRATIEAMGAKPVPIPLREKKNFSFDMDILRESVNSKTKLLIINSPSNPTGGTIPAGNLEEIAEMAQEFDFWVLSDEIYTRLNYSGERIMSIAEVKGMKERTIIVDGFSKTYSMTGWRLGFGLMPEALAEKVSLLITHSVGCTASFTQTAGIEALKGPQDMVETVRERYRVRRDIITTGLNKIKGVSCKIPQGAFYVFPNISSFNMKSEEMAEYILTEAGIALLPGTSFGSYGEGFLRLCFANSEERIRIAVEKIEAALKKL